MSLEDDLPASLHRAVGDPPPGPDFVAALRREARQRARRRAALAPAAVAVVVGALVAGVALTRPGPPPVRAADSGPPVVETALPTPQPSTAGCRPDERFPARTASVTRLSPAGELVWTRALPVLDDDQGQLQPLVIGDTAVVLSGGRLRGLDVATGRDRWQADAEGAPYGLWLSRGTVVVLLDQVSDHGRVVGFDAGTGKRRWTHQLGGNGLLGEQLLTPDGGLVLLRGDRLQVLDTGSGKVRWTSDGGGPHAGLADGLVVQPSGGRLVARDLDDGSVRWETAPLGTDVAVTVAEGVAVVTPTAIGPAIDPRQRAFDTVTGALAWTSPVPRAAAVVGHGDGVLLFAEESVGDASLYAVDARTGRARWHVASSPQVQSLPGVQPALVQGDVVVVSEGYGQRARTSRRALMTGDLLGSTPLPYERPSFAVGDDAYLVQSSAGADGAATATVTTASTGTPQWSTPVRHAEAQPRVLADGSVLLHGASPHYGCPLRLLSTAAPAPPPGAA